jgi:hypothetical protein
VDTGCHVSDLDPWNLLIPKYLYKTKPPCCDQEKLLLVNSNLTSVFIAPDAISAYKFEPVYEMLLLSFLEATIHQTILQMNLTKYQYYFYAVVGDSNTTWKTKA